MSARSRLEGGVCEAVFQESRAGSAGEGVPVADDQAHDGEDERADEEDHRGVAISYAVEHGCHF